MKRILLAISVFLGASLVLMSVAVYAQTSTDGKSPKKPKSRFNLQIKDAGSDEERLIDKKSNTYKASNAEKTRRGIVNKKAEFHAKIEATFGEKDNAQDIAKKQCEAKEKECLKNTGGTEAERICRAEKNKCIDAIKSPQELTMLKKIAELGQMYKKLEKEIQIWIHRYNVVKAGGEYELAKQKCAEAANNCSGTEGECSSKKAACMKKAEKKKTKSFKEKALESLGKTKAKLDKTLEKHNKDITKKYDKKARSAEKQRLKEKKLEEERIRKGQTKEEQAKEKQAEAKKREEEKKNNLLDIEF